MAKKKKNENVAAIAKLILSEFVGKNSIHSISFNRKGWITVVSGKEIDAKMKKDIVNKAGIDVKFKISDKVLFPTPERD